MNTLTFEQRCAVAQQCLPPAPYRDQLTALHADMLAELKRLLAIEAEWAAQSHEAHRLAYPGGGAALFEKLWHLTFNCVTAHAGNRVRTDLLPMQEMREFLEHLCCIVDSPPAGDPVAQARIAALEASTQPTAKPVEIDGIGKTEQPPLMAWKNGAPVDLAAAAADALKWLDLLDKMIGMGRAKFTDPESRNLLGNARANLAQFLPPDARTKQTEETTQGEAQ